MSLVFGNDVNLYYMHNGALRLLACGKSCTLNTTTEIAERTTSESGYFRQVKALSVSGSLSASGVIKYGDDLAVYDLHAVQFGLLPINWSFVLADDTNDTETTYWGRGVLENITQTGAVNEWATFDVTAVVDGEITVSVARNTCPVVVFSDIDADSITGTWAAITSATKYFYKITLAGDAEVIQQGETTGLTHTFTGLTADTAYTVYVFPFISGVFDTGCAGFAVTTGQALTGYLGRWGWQTSDPTADMAAATYQHSATFAVNSSAFIEFPAMPAEQFFYWEMPDTEADFTMYDNGFLMNTALPDQTFKLLTGGGKKYIVTRSEQTFNVNQIRWHR